MSKLRNFLQQLEYWFRHQKLAKDPGSFGYCWIDDSYISARMYFFFCFRCQGNSDRTPVGLLREVDPLTVIMPDGLTQITV